MITAKTKFKNKDETLDCMKKQTIELKADEVGIAIIEPQKVYTHCVIHEKYVIVVDSDIPNHGYLHIY